MNESKNKKLGIVLAAGGSKGAFGAGAVEYLLDVKKRKYSTIVATSTGTMKAPFITFGSGLKIRELYTSVEDKDIITRSPFGEKGNTQIRKMIYNILIKRKGSLGSNSNLLKTIRKNFTEVEFRALKMKDIDIIVCVNNATKNRNEYIHLKNCKYEEFTNWMYASSTQPILFENFKYNGCEYNDGAVFNYVAIEKAIEEGCTEIDVICNHPLEMEEENWKGSKNPLKKFFDNILRTLGQKFDSTFLLNVKVGKLLAEKHGVKLNFYAPPYSIEGNTLRFSKYRMKEWVKLGYATAQMKNEERKILIEKVIYE